LDSIETLLGTKAYPRLRGGVGRPADSRPMADHVLEKFTPNERPVVERMVEAAVEAVEIWRQKGWEAALPLGNRKVEA
jgi:PTH1 family peptidyl-tRNA hydrolase